MTGNEQVGTRPPGNFLFFFSTKSTLAEVGSMTQGEEAGGGGVDCMARMEKGIASSLVVYSLFHLLELLRNSTCNIFGL